MRTKVKDLYKIYESKKMFLNSFNLAFNKLTMEMELIKLRVCNNNNSITICLDIILNYN